MHGEEKERLETLIAPYGREVRLDDVRFESGMRLLRVTIREGMRITALDVDAQTALAWAKTMTHWAETRGRARKRKHRPWISFRFSSKSRVSPSQSREAAPSRHAGRNSRFESRREGPRLRRDVERRFPPNRCAGGFHAYRPRHQARRHSGLRLDVLPHTAIPPPTAKPGPSPNRQEFPSMSRMRPSFAISSCRPSWTAIPS